MSIAVFVTISTVVQVYIKYEQVSLFLSVYFTLSSLVKSQFIATEPLLSTVLVVDCDHLTLITK